MRDEPWRICDIQFDDPKVGIGLAPPFIIFGARFIARILGSRRLPDIFSGQRETALEQWTCCAAVNTLDEDRSDPIVTRREDRGKAAGGLRFAQKQIDKKTAGQACHWSARAVSGRIARFVIGEQRIERLVILCSAQPVGNCFVAQHSRHARESLEMVGAGIERRQQHKKEVDR